MCGVVSRNKIPSYTAPNVEGTVWKDCKLIKSWKTKFLETGSVHKGNIV
jgi:hypothetical protein